MLPSEVEKLFRAFAEKRKAELPRFTPDGIPITLENKFDDAIYNYLYKYWKEQSGEYDPKDDEIIMTKENSFTKNEKKFEQWLLQQYGMTKKEEREYTVKGNLLSLGEIALSAWGIEGAGATKLVVPGKFLASNADDSAKKALQQDTIEDAVEGTLKKEVAEEVAENTTKKEMADTAEDLSQKIVDKEDIFEESKFFDQENDIFENGFLPEEYYSGKHALKPPLIRDSNGNVKLYRTISESEYEAIKINHKFDTIPGAMSDKWFSTKIEDARIWGEKMDFGKGYKIIEITVPESLIDDLYYGGSNLDGIGPAFCAPLDIINEFSNTIKLIE